MSTTTDSLTRSIARVEYDGRTCEARKVPPTAWMNSRRFIDPLTDFNGFEVLRDGDDALRRRGLYVSDERLEPLDRRRLTHVVRDVEPVPMRRQHHPRIADRFEQPARVVVDLASLGHRADERDVGPQPLDFALDVIHRSKYENLPAVDPDQVRERAAFRELVQVQRRLDVDRDDGGRQRRVRIATQERRTPEDAVQAPTDSHGPPRERGGAG